MKLINADKVIKTLRARKKLFCKNQIEFRMLPPDQKARVDEIDTCISELINAKPIKTEQPRIRGRWIVEKDCEGKTRTCTCDLCGYKTGRFQWENPNFCANCGADMRGEQDE
jgi:hypothetical protein